MLTGIAFGAAALGAPWAGTSATGPALAATPVASVRGQRTEGRRTRRCGHGEHHLKAAIVRVLVDGEELVTIARGVSMNGVPATPEMLFRNGAIAISYLSTALLILVDRGVVSLDDPLSPWLPALPNADNTTPRMLANMTAG